MVKLVIVFVGLTLVATVVGVIVLAITGHDVPDTLKMLGTGALTGLVGMLVPANNGGTGGP